jgi:hypothetical protein
VEVVRRTVGLRSRPGRMLELVRLISGFCKRERKKRKAEG